MDEMARSPHLELEAMSSTFFDILCIGVWSSANEIAELREVDERKFGNEFLRKLYSDFASNA